MLISVDNLKSPSVRFADRRLLAVALLACVAFAVPVTGCRSASSLAGRITEKDVDDARQQLDAIPPPVKTRYLAIHSLALWQNPYLTVQGQMVTLHVTLADSNPTNLGEGGLLRPLGARQQTLNISTRSIPSALTAMPESSWPYGRVIAVEEAHNVPERDRPQVRRNLEQVMSTLTNLGVVAYEWNDGGPGLS